MATTKYALDVPGRFWPRVQMPDSSDPFGCWIWVGARNRKGYGVMSVYGHHAPAHRVSWMLAGRPLTPGLTLDHTCRVRECVNPDHLEEVTRGENVMRGDTLPAAGRLRTACLRGHPLDGIRTDHGRPVRYCKTCRSAQNYAYKRSLAALRNQP